ncbi:MAG: malectin domain-containing carbohydrate-binding protein [Candidatus Acidiferrales bacterium]
MGRSNYAVKLLTFVCEKCFRDQSADVKEYSIAVQALGRSADFDPQADTIVRVTAHSLRKRLEEYYRTEGAEHEIHICIPPGRYVPNFVFKSSLSEEQPRNAAPPVHPHNDSTAANGNGKVHANELSSRNGESTPMLDNSVKAEKPGKSVRIAGSLATVAFIALIVFYLWPRKGHASYGQAQAAPLAAPVVPVSVGPPLRAMMGELVKPYMDQAGFIWSPDRFCTGGNAFSVPKPEIAGTADPKLFESGREGTFACKFPVPPGTYEMHLLFAEAAGLQENARLISYAVDGGASNSLDVVDDSGADDTATEKILANVQPEPDGTIHLDFTAPHSFVNAVEILPDPNREPLPIRILAGRDRSYRDQEGQLWLPDRDFFGGRESSHGSEVRSLPDNGIYDGQRLGHFHYAIPVAPEHKYTLKLQFIERWFGIQNGNIGGAGSRVFDVSCNGVELLKNFDIMRDAQNAPLVKTFMHVEPTPQNKIEIYFTPNVNYPSLSAIEILPE